MVHYGDFGLVHIEKYILWFTSVHEVTWTISKRIFVELFRFWTKVQGTGSQFWGGDDHY